MRIQHALGIAGRPRRVAHRRGGIFIEHLPFEIAVDLCDPVLVGERVLQRGLRHMRFVGEHDVALDARKLVGDLFQDRNEGEVRHHDAVFRMVDDPGDLVREQARVDRMADGADAHDAVPGFEVSPGVPCDGGDAVAELDALAVELLRDFQRTRANFGVIGPVNRTLDRSRDHLALAMDLCCMIDNPMTQHGPILHQTAHSNAPPRGYRYPRRDLA